MKLEEENTTGDQLMACNGAGQGELDSGTSSKELLITGRNPEGEVRWDNSRSQWEHLELLAWRREI